ncbi:hypothetical protein F4703DRAFT_1799638 [Phycomyces blakesleeanus]|uniref:Maintenance of mitochondrial morphology protein 1 n=2 Tax=Phycomyces blakesleeanus TaxID=4837 RepID=A0A162N8S0_PHYB8|nr:hypothetical protein PHYBLDRAFT_159257 [Phycomyces blakesleeanus NRRL 1555(-)]OAD72158.1 hypothetical protein PHYBLDRAFT_159257 [Phycomyces blakesleeanus NRRL 1555(-)]|eukprot:XP_018290198.1 hypothetical protein PHYBLDRAFT_159257 [Phycomyces blakesleeanus NRRL 1555(-)]
METTHSGITPQVLDYIRETLHDHACSHNSAISFFQGFVLGQLSVITIVILALRYLLMEDVKGVKKRYIPSRLSASPPSRVNATAASQLPAAYITQKTYYDVVHHPPESTDWVNVLIAQAIMQYRDDAKINHRLILAVDEVLNGGVRPSFLGPIHVTELNLGEEFPIFSSARIRPSDDIGSMRAEIDFEYNDQITLGIETQLILNWPRQAFAALPVSLVLSVVKFSGTLTIELINPPETTTKPERPLERYIAISSYSDFVLDLNVRSLIGSRTKLEDIPKLTDLITSKLRSLYIDRLVYPTFVKVKVPNVWEERDRRTREHETEQAKDTTESVSPKPFGEKYA